MEGSKEAYGFRGEVHVVLIVLAPLSKQRIGVEGSIPIGVREE